MNRVIKFNAWLPELQYMLEDVAVGHGSIGVPFIDEPEDDFYQFLKSKGFITDDDENLPEYLYASPEDWCSIIDEKHYVLLQFTNLKDKNGKDIYEGDILTYDYADHKEIKEWMKGAYYTVGYEKSYVICGVGLKDKMYLHGFRFKFAEVIGNIYHNPELIQPTNIIDQGCPFDEKLN